MKRIIGALSCLILLAGAVAALSAENEITGPLFVPIAYLTERGKILDANHVALGRIDKDGIVYDVTNKHLGFVTPDLTVRDIHHDVLAVVGEDGTMTDSAGEPIGRVTDVKVADGAGRPVAHWEGTIDKRGVLAYLFFFAGTFDK
jgi:hypothetical protein